MKKVLFFIGLLLPFQAVAENIHIASNVDADIYVNGEKTGKTPMIVNYEGGDVVLKKDGYKTAVLSEKRLKGRSGSSGQGLAKMSDGAIILGTTAIVAVEATAGGLGYVTSGGVGLAVGLAVLPVIAVINIYADNHHYATLFPENATPRETMLALKQTEIRHLTLSGFNMQFQPEFIDALSVKTGLSADAVRQVLRDNPTPDGAANALAAKIN